MDFHDYEKIFLLEVLVDFVSIHNSQLNLNLDTKSKLKETCVTFQFLNYPPLVVCEEDFYKSPPNPQLSELNFKSGKSCLFSINSSDVPALPYQFDINVSVVRKVEPKSQITLGTSTINLGDSFTALLHSSVAEPDLPVQKTKSGKFEIYDDNKRTIGFINSFLRLSCFGELIVTQFQVGANKDAFMFKGTEQKNVVEIKGDSTKMPRIQADPTYMTARLVEDTQQVTKPAFNGYGDVSERMIMPYQQLTTEAMIPQYNYEQPLPSQDSPDTGNYKEIVAEIRGHSLHIRVPTKSNKEVLCKKQLVEGMEGPVCKYAPQLDFCDCDFPVPPEAIPRCGPF